MTYVLRSASRPKLDAPDFNDHKPRELIATAETYEAGSAGRSCARFE